MKKKKYYFLLLTAAACLSFSGCKSREKVDLTSSHTEAESMSPTTAAAKETEAAKPEETAEEETKKGQSSASALSVRSQIATHKDGKVSIEYPILSNLKNADMEETINTLIKEKAIQILTDYEVNAASDTVAVQCTVVSLDRSRAVLTYEGSLMTEGAAHPTALFYTTTVDLDKGALMGLSDYADAYTMAGYLVSDDCVVHKPSNSSEVKDYLKSQSLEDWWEILKQCDFTASGLEGFPQAFSYENEGTIYISVPVSHAIGDFAIVSYTPDTK